MRIEGISISGKVGTAAEVLTGADPAPYGRRTKRLRARRRTQLDSNESKATKNEASEFDLIEEVLDETNTPHLVRWQVIPLPDLGTMTQADSQGPTPVQGTYLLHFTTPYKHARHYMGYSKDVASRLKRHKEGSGEHRGAKLLEVVRSAGIDWVLVRVWPGPQTMEAKLKRRHNSPQLCPICKSQAKERRLR